MAGNIKQAAKNKASQTAKNMAPQEAQQAAQGAKDAANAVKNIYAGNKVQGVKDAFKALKNKEFRKWLVIIGIAGLLIPIIIAGCFISVMNAIPNAVTKLVSSVTSDITKSWNDPVNGKMTIEIDQDKYKLLKENLGAQAIDTKAVGLTDECIKIFLLAEYATQYPVDVEIKIFVTADEKSTIINKIGMSKFLDGDYIKATGCVELYRPEFAGNNRLKITDVNTLEKYEKEEGNISFNDVKDKYALDKSGNIIVAQRDTKKVIKGEDELNPTATEVNLNSKDYDEKFDWESFNKKKPESEDETRRLRKLPYKNEITMYSMPFEFLSELTSFTGCTEYGLKVASLVTDKTKIKINILDESKTTETRVTEAYDRVHDVDYTAGAKMKLMQIGLWGSGRIVSGPKIGEKDERNVQFYINDFNTKESDSDYYYSEMIFNNKEENKGHFTYSPNIYEKRKNTIETEYTAQIQVVEAESWFVKKTSECKIDEEKQKKVLDDSLDKNPKVDDKKDDINFLNWAVPYDNYKSLNELYENESTFKEYIEMYNADSGANLEDFKSKLNDKYDKNKMINYAKYYSEDDLRKGFVQSVLHQNYTTGQSIVPRSEDEKTKLDNMNNAISAYNKMSNDWKVDKNSYEYLPTKIQVTGKNVQERTAVYKSERIYNVSNVKEEDNTDEFIKLLVKQNGDKKEYVYYKTPNGNHAPISDFITGSEMFFQIVADNDKTANLEDAMRYILYKITGVDYGVTNFKKALISMQRFGTGDILYDYIRIRENYTLYRFYKGEISASECAEYVSDKHYKTIADPTPGYMDFAYGIVLNPSCNDDVFEEFGVPANKVRQYTSAGMEVTELSHEQAERLFERSVNKRRDEIKSSVASDLNEDIINALTIIKYAFGNIGNFNEVYHLYKEGKIEQFKASYSVEGVNVFSGTCLGWDGDDVKLIYRMFSEGYYEINGIVLNKEDYKKPKTSGRGGPIVEKAIECHQYLRENEFSYGWDGYAISEFATSGSKHVDCAGFVGWVLYEAGFDSFASYELDYASNHHELIQVPTNEVQPGDIVVIAGEHVEIAAAVENGVVTLVYNCGGDNSIQSQGTPEYPETIPPYRNNYDVVLRAP